VCLTSRTVHCSGERIELTRRECDLLVYLAEHPQQVFTREQLQSAVWGTTLPGSRTVDVHVRRMRSKLGRARAAMSTT
jgi:DNA-binding response OmpR family regulator